MKHSSKLVLFFVVLFQVSNLNGQILFTRFLDEIPIKTFSDGIQSVVANVNQKGNPITIGGNVYKKGIGLESTSVFGFFARW